MKISTFIYSLKQGFKNIRRNKLFSLASVGTIASCIFLMGMFGAILANFVHIVDETEKNVCITVFFDEGIEQEKIDGIGEAIRKRVEVARLEFTSAEEAWEEFKVEYFAEAPELAEGFAEDNPLANSAYYDVYLNDISMQSALKKHIEGMEGVRKVNASEVVASTLTDFGHIVSYISIAVIVILLAVGIFLISNTVMIGIAVRKEEIGIMKLIGATDFFIRVPFMVEGIIIGLIGAVIPLIALFFLYKNVILYLVSEFQTISNKSVFLKIDTVFNVMVPCALLIGAGIGFVGSMITIKKHLKV
ncbi:MAG: ABC transporter permease [Lachnospiraceae bacterium]|nr:ABC transporter permease [Lachnospiraceae bacterium]MBQ4069735.1 permease-like cell division protein FtsX [Lachnospiraceae bacterium]